MNNEDLFFEDLFNEGVNDGDFEIITDIEDTEIETVLPHNPNGEGQYIPRHYQLEFWNMYEKYTRKDFEIGYCSEEEIDQLKHINRNNKSLGFQMKEKFKRMIFCWHRRAGKDIDTWQRFLLNAFLNKGIYYYMLPTASQAKKVIFDGMTNDGIRFIDYMPKELLKWGQWNSTDMKAELSNGSIIQILGSDNYDRIVGANPKGVVFSEFALCNPAAWTYMRPMLKLNGGFAWFISTPRGRNHFYDLVQTAKRNKNKWIVSELTIYDTGLMTEEDYKEEIEDGMEESKARQEYLVDFNAPVKGSYYSGQINKVYEEERFLNMDFNKAIPVKVAFDIGVNDKTSMIFFNMEKDRVNILKHYMSDGKGLEHYIQQIHKFESKNDCYVSDVYFPHDMKVKEFAGGKKRIDVAREALIDQKVHVLKKSSVEEGIDVVRRVLPYCYFKKDNEKYGIKYLLYALTSYRKEYDEKKQEYKNNPLHDWSSHPSDCFRYLASVVDKEILRIKRNARGKITQAKGMRGDVI